MRAGDQARTNRPASWRAASRRRRSRARRVRRAPPRRTRPPPPPCSHRCGRRFVRALFPCSHFPRARNAIPHTAASAARAAASAAAAADVTATMQPTPSKYLDPETPCPHGRRVSSPPGPVSWHLTAASARSSPPFGTTRIIYAGDGIPRAVMAATQQRLHRR